MKVLIDIILSLIAAIFAGSAPKPVRVSGPHKGPWPIPSNLDMIKESEQLRLTAYMPTKNDVPTIGWGHTSGVSMNDVITEAKAEAYLQSDVAWVKTVLDSTVSVALTENQVAALYSFIFNIGGTNFRTSTLLRVLNAGDYEEAANQFKRWNKQKGKVLRGLTIRRKAEATLFRKV